MAYEQKAGYGKKSGMYKSDAGSAGKAPKAGYLGMKAEPQPYEDKAAGSVSKGKNRYVIS